MVVPRVSASFYTPSVPTTRGGQPVRDYTPEYESFRDDAVAVLGGVAVAVAVIGWWSKPLLMAPLALVLALANYALSPRAKGGTVLAVVLITIVGLIGNRLI